MPPPTLVPRYGERLVAPMHALLCLRAHARSSPERLFVPTFTVHFRQFLQHREVLFGLCAVPGGVVLVTPTQRNTFVCVPERTSHMRRILYVPCFITLHVYPRRSSPPVDDPAPHFPLQTATQHGRKHYACPSLFYLRTVVVYLLSVLF